MEAPLNVLVRTALVSELAAISTWTGEDLLALLGNEGRFVRQVRTGCSWLNLHIEKAPDQTACPAGAVRLWLDIGNGTLHQGVELFAYHEYVEIGSMLDW
jgi:hypothetical protein